MHKMELKYHMILAEYFSSQPICYNCDIEKPNQRKCIEQVYQLSHSNNYTDLENTLLDLLFLQAKAFYLGISSVRIDFLECLHTFDNEELDTLSVRTVYQTILFNLHRFGEKAKYFYYLMYDQLWWREGRLGQVALKSLNDYRRFRRCIIRQCRFPNITSTNLESTIHMYGIYGKCKLTFDETGKYFAVYTSKSKMIIVYDLLSEKATRIYSNTTSSSPLSCKFNIRNKSLVSFWNNGALQINRMDGGLLEPYQLLPAANSLGAVISSDAAFLCIIFKKSLKVISLKEPKQERYLEFSDEIIGCSYCKTRSLVAAAMVDGTIHICNPAEGNICLSLFCVSGDITTLSFSSDGKYIAAACRNKTIVLWRLNESLSTQGSPVVLEGHSDTILNIAFSANSQMLLSTGMDSKTILWDLPANKARFIEKNTSNENRNTDVTFLNSDTQYAICNSEGVVTTYSIINRYEFGALCAHKDKISDCISLGSPLIAFFITSSWDCSIKVWDQNQFKELVRFDQHTSKICKLRAMPSALQFCSEDVECNRYIWDILKGKPIGITPINPIFLGYHKYIHSPDGKVVAYARDPLELCILVDSKTKWSKRCEHIDAIGISDDKQCVYVADKNKLKIYRIDDGNCMAQFECNQAISAIGIPHLGNVVAIGSFDGGLSLWLVDKCVEKLVDYKCFAGITALSFNQNDKQLACGDESGNFYIFTIEHIE